MKLVTLARRDLALVALQELPERRAFEDLRIRSSAEAIDLSFQIARPLFGFELAVKGFATGLHAASTHLRLPASSELSGSLPSQSPFVIETCVGCPIKGAKEH